MGADPGPEDMPALRRQALAQGLEQVVACGNRFPGTVGEAICREFLLEAFERTGLDGIRSEPFRHLAYEPVAASCRSLRDGWELPCNGVQGTANAVAEGDAVYLGACEPADVERIERLGIDLTGKVVVVQSQLLPLSVAPLLAKKNVAALVNVSGTPDGLIAHFVGTFYPPSLVDQRILPYPGVTIEAEAARRLLSELSVGPTRLRVEHRATYVEKESSNVVGTLVGDTTDELVLVGAHYDTQLEGKGANDNATGVALLVELARSWARLRPRRSVVFVAFGAEETGAWGSYSYALEHRGEHDRTVAMVNLDSLGMPLTAVRSALVDSAIAGFARESSRRVGFEVDLELDGSEVPFGDHSPFIDAGVPACQLWRYPPAHPYYHSAGDVLARVDVDRFVEAATANAYLAFRLAHVPELAFGRSQPKIRWAPELQAPSDAVAATSRRAPG
jgi:aminopeptidase YwaD